MKEEQLSIFSDGMLMAVEQEKSESNKMTAESRKSLEERETWEEFGMEEQPKNERDRVLKAIRQANRELTNHAFDVAARISRESGIVTSTKVLAELRADPEWRDQVAEKDARFMGVVFRRTCWTRVGFSQCGSHGRPVSIWRLKPEFQKS
tara:strand:- start:1799 stop:2248 length:450 start_codon:yes stop_codon:yes gene_type:complete